MKVLNIKNEKKKIFKSFREHVLKDIQHAVNNNEEFSVLQCAESFLNNILSDSPSKSEYYLNFINITLQDYIEEVNNVLSEYINNNEMNIIIYKRITDVSSYVNNIKNSLKCDTVKIVKKNQKKYK
jgi:hypothetical protein